MPGRIQAARQWFGEAGKRLLTFVLSLVCGIALPLAPVVAEGYLKGSIDEVTWFSAGVPYVAAIGLVSKSREVLLLMLIGALALAFLYGVDLMADLDKHPKPFSSTSAQYGIFATSIAYLIERVGLHLFDNRPFPE